MGWDLVNMTQYPEAALAREAGIPYAGLALVTDYDAGLEHDASVEPVSQERVFEMFEANLGTAPRGLGAGRRAPRRARHHADHASTAAHTAPAR